MASPYSFGPFEFDAPGGVDSLVELKIPWRGTIKAVRLMQVSGADVAAVVNIYNSRAAASAVASDSSAGISGNPAMYRIMPAIAVVSGAIYETYERDFIYITKDGTSTNPDKAVYLVIEPAGTGAKTWSISLEIEQASLT